MHLVSHSKRSPTHSLADSLTLLIVVTTLHPRRRRHAVATLLHGPQHVLVVGVEVVVEAQEVKLRVGRLLGFQHDLKLRPLLAHEAGRALNDVVGLDGGRLHGVRVRENGEEEAFEGQKDAFEGQKEAFEGQKDASEGQKEASEGRQEASEGRKEASEGQEEVFQGQEGGGGLSRSGGGVSRSGGGVSRSWRPGRMQNLSLDERLQTGAPPTYSLCLAEARGRK